MKKTKFYLVGNAHLDPVWQWRWQEGSAEAKATVRSALDRMKEYDDFKFVCSSASVYRWIEEFDNDMFEEIKMRVKEGRFVIVGGWYVQPDCNLPSGEGFARQTLYSQRYFMENFGTMAKVGYNVDSFGHNANLPQILKKSGMDQYIFMRPAPHENNLDSDIFNWKSADGSSVLTYRILDPYCCKFDEMEKLEERIAYLDETTKAEIDSIPFFYGVGNHGGGPTIRHIELLKEYANAHPECEMYFSTLLDFFDRVRSDGCKVPDYTGDLQHHAAGCYATVSDIKNGIRRSECELLAAEEFSVLARRLCNKKYDSKKFENAWNNVCFLHFHDIMDGCCIKEVYDDTKYMYGSALEVAAVAENNALQTISWAVDTVDDKETGIPVFVFNPHPFSVRQCVQVNQKAVGILDSNKKPVPWQLVRSSTKECYNRPDIAFMAEVPALGYAVYYLVGAKTDPEEGFKAEESDVKAYDTYGSKSSFGCSTIHLENEYWHLKFENYSGYISSFFDKKAEKEIITDRAAVPVVIDEYYHDTWSHDKNFFTNEMARFSDAEVKVVESGPVRATVKVVSRYNNSTLTQYFTLYSNSKKIEVRASVDWHEKHKMLKIKWPFVVENPKAIYEIPFGFIERPADGEEEPGLMWFGVKGTNGGYAICNSDTYSSSVKNGTLYHTVLRSPIYGDHGGPRSDESDYTEQGVREFKYVVMPFDGANAEVIKESRALNKPLTNVIENWHSGKISDKVYEGINVSADNVVVSAVKRSEDEKGLVVRLYETEGEKTSVTVKGGVIDTPLKAEITPFSFETYLLEDGKTEWKKVMLTEYDYE